MNLILAIAGFALWGYLMWWMLQGSRAQGRARALFLTIIILVLYALGVKF